MGIFGVIMTTLWFFFIGFLLSVKLDEALKLTINEWGDFLAGVTAPIAFLWLIIGYYLQRNELKMNTEALHAQQKELSKQVEELSKQNAILQESSSHTERLARAMQDLPRHQAMYGR